MGISCTSGEHMLEGSQTGLEFTGDTDFSALYNRVRTVDLVVTTVRVTR